MRIKKRYFTFKNIETGKEFHIPIRVRNVFQKKMEKRLESNAYRQELYDVIKCPKKSFELICALYSIGMIRHSQGNKRGAQRFEEVSAALFGWHYVVTNQGKKI